MEKNQQNQKNENGKLVNQPQNSPILTLNVLGKQLVDEVEAFKNGQKRFVEFAKNQRDILALEGVNIYSYLQAEVLFFKARNSAVTYADKLAEAQLKLNYVKRILSEIVGQNLSIVGTKLLAEGEVKLNNTKFLDVDNTKNIKSDETLKERDAYKNKIVKSANKNLDEINKILESIGGSDYSKTKGKVQTEEEDNFEKAKNNFENLGSSLNQSNSDLRNNDFENFEFFNNEELKAEGLNKEELESEDFQFSKDSNLKDGSFRGHGDNKLKEELNKDELKDDFKSFNNETTKDEILDENEAKEEDFSKFEEFISNYESKKLKDTKEENKDNLNSSSNSDAESLTQEQLNNGSVVENPKNKEVYNTIQNVKDNPFQQKSETEFGDVDIAGEHEELEIKNVFSIKNGKIDLLASENAGLVYGIYNTETFNEAFNILLDVAYCFPLSVTTLPDEAMLELKAHKIDVEISNQKLSISTLNYLIKFASVCILERYQKDKNSKNLLSFYRWVKSNI